MAAEKRKRERERVFLRDRRRSRKFFYASFFNVLTWVENAIFLLSTSHSLSHMWKRVCVCVLFFILATAVTSYKRGFFDIKKGLSN